MSRTFWFGTAIAITVIWWIVLSVGIHRGWQWVKENSSDGVLHVLGLFAALLWPAVGAGVLICLALRGCHELIGIVSRPRNKHYALLSGGPPVDPIEEEAKKEVERLLEERL